MHPTFAATDRTLTELDHVRLIRLLQRQSECRPTLAGVLDGADVVPSRAVEADVVTMYSQAQVLDAATGERSTLTLCYPQDADPAAGCVSVLSPVGRALLGLRVGDVAQWATPNGGTQSVRIVALPFQPEASGDYTR